MITSEQVDKIFPALIKSQSEMGNAKKSSANPFFKSKYADLSEIIEVSKDVLSSNGIGIIQSPGGNGSVVTVTARLIHESGQWIEDTITLTPTKNDPQAIGSAITYGRRYQLAALMNMAQEDDDGNTASEKPPKNESTKQGKDQTDEIIKGIIELTSGLNKYLSEGLFDHPDNVRAVMKAGDIERMTTAYNVGKEKADAMAKEAQAGGSE